MKIKKNIVHGFVFNKIFCPHLKLNISSLQIYKQLKVFNIALVKFLNKNC